MKSIILIINIINIIILILFAVSYEYWSYQSVKEYYPDLTYPKYLLLRDKLRITPND